MSSPQPSSQALYVTFHDAPDVATGVATPEATVPANVDVIDQYGFVAKSVLEVPPSPYELAELRALVFRSNLLWVVGGAKNNSEIFLYSPSMVGGHHEFCGVVNSTGWSKSLSHPFDLAFIPGQQTGWFVSNQNTNIVVGPFVENPRPPTPGIAPYLHQKYPSASFCPGTFVASAVTPATACGATQLVPKPQGLEGDFQKASRHSVRGLAHNGELLFVADEVANKVKGYNAPGQLVWTFPSDTKPTVPVKGPVHLLLSDDRRYLFVGSSGNETLVKVDLSGASAPMVLATGIKELSGMAMNGDLYYASRATKQIYRIPASQLAQGAGPAGGGTPYGPALEHPPEFIACAP